MTSKQQSLTHKPVKGLRWIDFVEIPGPLEVSAHGIIGIGLGTGQVVDTAADRFLNMAAATQASVLEARWDTRLPIATFILRC